MTLPTSGPLSLNDIALEFSDPQPNSLSEFYAGGGLVPSGATGINGAIPSSGTISIGQFYGAPVPVEGAVTIKDRYDTAFKTWIESDYQFNPYRGTITPEPNWANPNAGAMILKGRLSLLTVGQNDRWTCSSGVPLKSTLLDTSAPDGSNRKWYCLPKPTYFQTILVGHWKDGDPNNPGPDVWNPPEATWVIGSGTVVSVTFSCTAWVPVGHPFENGYSAKFVMSYAPGATGGKTVYKQFGAPSTFGTARSWSGNAAAVASGGRIITFSERYEISESQRNQWQSGITSTPSRAQFNIYMSSGILPP